MLTLYSQQDSGNCYKPRLLLAHLKRPFQIVDMAVSEGSTRQPDFLERNPNGKVPLLEFDDGRNLAESNAMLLHLAEGTELLPNDTYDRAKVYEWLFFEQYSHEPTIAVRRSLTIYPHLRAEATPERMANLLSNGNKALGVMEARLKGSDYLAGESISVADLALYAYTHLAYEGGFDLSNYPAVSAWLRRVSSLPGHVDIEWRPNGG